MNTIIAPTQNHACDCLLVTVTVSATAVVSRKRRERLFCEHFREASASFGRADLDRRGRRSQRRSQEGSRSESVAGGAGHETVGVGCLFPYSLRVVWGGIIFRCGTFSVTLMNDGWMLGAAGNSTQSTPCRRGRTTCVAAKMVGNASV